MRSSCFSKAAQSLGRFFVPYYAIFINMKNKHSRKKQEDKKRRTSGHSRNSRGSRKRSFENQQFEGVIFLTMRGNGFVRTGGPGDDIEIEKENLNTALDRDIVKISIDSKNNYGRKTGRVEEVVQRSKTEFVGTIQNKEGLVYFEPDNKKFYRDLVIIPNRKSEHIKSNQKVLVKMEEWTNPAKNPKGEIVKIIGEKGDHNTEMESIIYEKGFNPQFPSEIEKEAQKIKANAPADFEAEVKRRVAKPDGPPSSWDFRNTTTFTIDPFDAKDFDDALSFKDMGDGTYEVGIHIADVTHYVTEGSLIDKEAIKRGTSIYLVDRTIPMLPEVLSNDLCSLNPNEDKLAYSAIFIINNKCEVQKRWFGETIINSNKRFSYKDAQKVLDDGKGEFFEELNQLNEMALLKRLRRTKNGAISFGSTEVQFELDKKGVPISIHEKKLLETNELIEDYMLLANREVSEYIDRLNKKSGVTNPFVYRIHDLPKKEKINELIIFLKKIGINLETDNETITSQGLNDLLEKIKGMDEQALIEKAILKSMSKAIYSTNNIGHFGLAFEHYTHFTSPIRRYPDMMVHRLMKKYLKGETVSQEELKKYSDLSAHSSQQEILAVEAERDSIKYKYTEYMSSRIGEEFDGIITSVVDWGVYVQDVVTKAEGLVSVRTLKDDRYNIDPANYRIVGEANGKKYTLGDRLRVKLIGTDLDKRNIDFDIVE